MKLPGCCEFLEAWMLSVMELITVGAPQECQEKPCTCLAAAGVIPLSKARGLMLRSTSKTEELSCA